MSASPPPATATVSGPPRTMRGLGLMLASTLFFAGMNASVHHVAAQLHPFEVAFFRSLFGFLVLAPLLVRHGLQPLRTRRLRLHALRGGLACAVMLLSFMALALSPLATFAALSFSTPLFATLLALVLLGEAIRLPRLGALAVGFVGTLVIVRPGFVALDVGAVLVLISTACQGSTTIVTKVLSRTESSSTIILYQGVFLTPLTLVAAIAFWQAPTALQLGWLAAIGTFGTLGHLSFTQALKEADVSAILPLDFAKLIWAAVIGYLFFAEVPEVWTWAGGIMIFSAVVFIAYREGPPPVVAPAARRGSG